MASQDNTYHGNGDSGSEAVLPPPSLLDPQSAGGDVAESGFSFQASYILTCICSWLSLDGFTSIIREAMGDTEANFFAPGCGFERETRRGQKLSTHSINILE